MRWLAFAMLLAAMIFAPGARAVGEITIRDAVLVAASGERPVSLPHILGAADFDPEGDRVRFRLRVDLAAPPHEDLGIYVPKMSLSGGVTLNGVPVGQCAVGELERLRCLHQPQLLVPVRTLWRTGPNEIGFELFVNRQQTNGLSAVTVGPAERLATGRFALQHFLQVELLRGLAWATVCLGIASLVLALLFRDTPGFGWFGLTAIVNALCNLNVLVQHPLISVEFFSWFVFSARLISIPLLVLTFLIFLGRDTAAWRRALGGGVLVLPILVWASGSDVRVVTALYLPFLLLAPLVLVLALRWTWQSRRTRHLLGCFAMAVTVAAGVHDWIKFTGVANFERTYLLSYANAVTLILLAAILIATIAAGLSRSRRAAAILRERIRKREAELRAQYAERTELERTSARYEERERLLRDMHDGIGSSLSSARILLRSGRLSAQEAAEVLQECADDLRLMIDASGNLEGILEDALADFRYRLEHRIDPAQLTLVWRIALDAMPPMTTDDLVQLMRILQEACSNAFRHANASLIEIRAAFDPVARELELTVRDDGCGIGGASGPTRGKGLHNMHRRATALGARLVIANAEPGTRVTVRMHVPATDSALAFPKPPTSYPTRGGRH